MLKISLPWILHVMASVDRLQQITTGQPVHSAWFLCFDAKQNVDAIFVNSVYSPHLKISRERASMLKTALDEMSPQKRDQESAVTDLDAWMIKFHGNQFREVFMAELNILPSFLVNEKEGYDINALTDGGHKLFPASILRKCPETKWDMREAGKALAFELATACGFHVFRVTEAVLKRYWDHISGGKARPNPSGIGAYATELKNKNLGDKKIYEALIQLAKLHRNPLVHPEVILTVEEAIETLGIARSVMGAMLRSLPDGAPSADPGTAP